jgi:hypothetical protein
VDTLYFVGYALMDLSRGKARLVGDTHNGGPAGDFTFDESAELIQPMS